MRKKHNKISGRIYGKRTYNEIENDKFLSNYFYPRDLLSVSFHIKVALIDVPLLKTKIIVCIVKHANYCTYNKGITGSPY